MTRRGCGCCTSETCDLFNIDGSTDPLSNGFSTEYIGTWPTSASGLVIPAFSYLQWDTDLPTTGVLLKAIGASASRLDPGIELVIVDSFGSEVVAARKTAADILTIAVGGTDTNFTLLRDAVATAGSTILGTYSAFHELMVTQLAAQTRRYEADDPFGFFLYTSPLYWDDGDFRERVTDSSFALSARMSSLLPAGSKARIVNNSGSDVTVAYWRADKTPDLVESEHLPCDEKREVCRLVNDNHVQRWSFDPSTFAWEGLALRSTENRRSTNCAYFEESGYGTIGEVPPDYKASTGTVSQEYLWDRFFYFYTNYAKNSAVGTISYDPPDDPLVLDSYYNIEVVPKAHPSDPTKLLLDVTLNFLAPGLIYDGTPPAPSNVSITAPGATITATVTNEEVNDTGYIPTLLASETPPSGQAWTGQCYNTELYGGTGGPVSEGDVVDGFRTQQLSSVTRQRYKWQEVAGLYWVDGLQVSLFWSDVEVSKWAGTSPTLNLSGADADVTINDNSLASVGSDNVYVYQSGSTALNSSSTPFNLDSYTPQTANPYGTFNGEIVAGAGTCPVSTGTMAVSFNVTTESNFKRVDFSTISITLTGSL